MLVLVVRRRVTWESAPIASNRLALQTSSLHQRSSGVLLITPQIGAPVQSLCRQSLLCALPNSFWRRRLFVQSFAKPWRPISGWQCACADLHSHFNQRVCSCLRPWVEEHPNWLDKYEECYVFGIPRPAARRYGPRRGVKLCPI